nr:retrovirus-related Pol polyprotein from transposon TNT 1-94 [Tanacetum cinerariifolium]
KLNYSTPTNNNQRISSNPRNRQIVQPGSPAGYNDVIGNQNQIRNGNLVVARIEGNATGQNGNQIRCYNCRGVGHYVRNCTVKPRKRDAAYLQIQLLIAQKEEAGIQLQAEEYDLMAAAADLDDIEEVNVNCILMANLQQASTSGTQTDSSPVYNTNGSAEVHENCDDNEIFNMFTQEEQYTELLEPIPESHQVSQNDNDVISEDTSVEQGLWYTKDSSFEQIGFSDADYVGCKDTFKSASGGAQFLGQKLVSWSSKKQDCTALSITKAEYVSLFTCCAQVLWMRTQLTDYGFYFNKIPIYYDLKSAIAISCNPVQHSRTKHLAVRYHFIKEHVEKLYFSRRITNWPTYSPKLFQ